MFYEMDILNKNIWSFQRQQSKTWNSTNITFGHSLNSITRFVLFQSYCAFNFEEIYFNRSRPPEIKSIKPPSSLDYIGPCRHVSPKTAVLVREGRKNIHIYNAEISVAYLSGTWAVNYWMPLCSSVCYYHKGSCYIHTSQRGATGGDSY